MTKPQSRPTDYWRYAASVDHCNVVIRRYEDEIAAKRKLVREWKKRRFEAIRLAEEHRV